MVLSLLCVIVTFAVVHADTLVKEERLTMDGLPFMINQKDWKPKTFKLFDMELVDTQGFVDENYLPLDNREYDELMEACAEQLETDSVPMYVYSKDSTVVYYPDNKRFGEYRGIDMIPENRDSYVKGEDYDRNLNFEDSKKVYNGDMMMKRCRINMKDGGAWHLQRMGPFNSTGGYDWWQLAYPDVGMFSEVVGKYPQGIDVIKQIFVPIHPNGTRLNLPPIHTHHIHTLPQPGLLPRLNARPMCLGKTGFNVPILDRLVAEKNCYNFTLMFEQHGDYICEPEDDGLECLTQGDKNPRRMVQAIDLEGVLNDVRPKDSKPLLWYYQVAMRWKPADVTKPVVSQMTIFGPGRIFPPDQSSKSYTSTVDPSKETFYIYSNHMHVDGDLLRGKAHSHATLTDSSLLFSGKLEDLGLKEKRFEPRDAAYISAPVDQAGFATNEELAQYVFANLKKSQDKWDQYCDKGRTATMQICARPRPDFICGAVGSEAFVEYEGKKYGFDRRPLTNCKPWTFKQGDWFTVLGLNKKITTPISWNNPNSPPKELHQHHLFFLSYIDRARGHTYNDALTTTYEGEFHHFQNKLNLVQLASIITCVVLFQGPPVHESTVVFIQWIWFFVFIALFVLAIKLSVIVGKYTLTYKDKIPGLSNYGSNKQIEMGTYVPVQTHDENDIDEIEPHN